MQGLDDAQVRACFVNASRREVSSMALPDLSARDWSELDFLAWRDRKAPQRACLVRWLDGSPVGIVLRAPESRISGRVSAMCLLCSTPQSGDGVALFVARRAGRAGREHNTVGTYACIDLDCSATVRVPPRPTPARPDPDEVVAQRVAQLGTRVDGFLAQVLRG